MNKTVAQAIVDPVIYSTPDAYDELLKGLRHDDPVHWTEPEGYRPFWTVTKYADILEVERQQDKFHNEPRMSLVPIAEEERVRAGSGRGTTNSSRMLVNMDEPDHRAHRAITQSWFMPPNLKKLESTLAVLAKEFVDRMENLGGRCDFVRDVAQWYPLRVIMSILGVPPEDDKKILAWTNALLGSYDPEATGGVTGVEARQAAIMNFFGYYTQLAVERRKNPKDDLASVIANAEIDGQPISDYEAMSYYLIISTAGHDTTSATISGGLLALMQNPGEMAKLRANPELLGSAIDEMLRWVNPVTHFFRTATQDYELRGRQIKAGQSLMMCYRSGNRDEEAFADPYAFKIDRSPNRHIAFGHGVHTCLGMHLAKMEIRALYREMLSRIDRFELAGDPAWTVTMHVPAMKRLPLAYTFRQQAA